MIPFLLLLSSLINVAGSWSSIHSDGVDSTKKDARRRCNDYLQMWRRIDVIEQSEKLANKQSEIPSDLFYKLDFRTLHCFYLLSCESTECIEDYEEIKKTFDTYIEKYDARKNSTELNEREI